MASQGKFISYLKKPFSHYICAC